MGNRATITAAPFNESNVAIYVHWNGGRASVEGFCKAAKELGYGPLSSEYGLARLTGLIASFFGIDEGLSLGVGLVSDLISAGDDNGCYVIGDDWTIVERRGSDGGIWPLDGESLEYDVDEFAEARVAEVRAAAVLALREECQP
jgi:hypothetical protein